MVSAWPEAPYVIPAEWPAERTAGAITKRYGTGVRSITKRTPVPPTVMPAAKAKGRKRWLKLTNV